MIVAGSFLVAAVATGLLVGVLTLDGHTFGIAVLVWFLIPVITWRWPHAGVAMLLGLALVIEEYPSIAGLKTITESVPIFKSLAVYAGLSGLVVNPAALIIAAVALTWVAKSAAEGTLALAITTVHSTTRICRRVRCCDQGLVSLRVAIVIGAKLGTVEVAQRISPPSRST